MALGMKQPAIARATGISKEYVNHLNTCFEKLGAQASQMCRDGQVNRDACYELAKNADVDQGWVLDRAKELCRMRDAQKRKGRRTPAGKIAKPEIAQAVKEWRERGRSKKAKAHPISHQFDVVIERDEEGFYVASVPAIRGCHTQARSLDEVISRIREAMELCLQASGGQEDSLEFVGIQRVTVAA
jgi:predicted RNase H-like HicB family nuclease